MWTCPYCKRTFKNTGQKHHCELTTTEAQLTGQSEAVLKIFHEILSIVRKIGPFTESPIKDYVMLKNKSTFLTIKPRKKYLDITFFLDDVSDEFPIFNSRRASKHRAIHVARFESPEDISPAVRRWIKQSYHLIAK